MSPRISVLGTAQIAALVDEVLATEVGPAIVEVLAEGRAGDTAIASTTVVRTKLRVALDDLDAALQGRSRTAYVRAASRIAALAVVLLMGRRLDPGGG